MTTAMLFSAKLQNRRMLSSNPSDTSIHENQQPSLQPAEAIPALLEESIMYFHETVSYLVPQFFSSFVPSCTVLIGFQPMLVKFQYISGDNYKVKATRQGYKSKVLPDSAKLYQHKSGK